MIHQGEFPKLDIAVVVVGRRVANDLSTFLRERERENLVPAMK